MRPTLEEQLGRWRHAGLIDADVAARIAAFESSAAPSRLRWPMQVALGIGGLMVAAGVLLFVAAHWNGLGPPARLLLLLGTISLFHLAGARAEGRAPALATTLHAIGTAALGAAIFLLGQLYNLDEQWPRGFLLWALGGWAGWFLLRSWPQLLFAAVLTPVWLISEWAARYGNADPAAPAVGLVVLSFVYLLAERSALPGASRNTLGSVGAIAILPLCTFLLVLAGDLMGIHHRGRDLSVATRGVAWVVAIGLPLGLAYYLRGREAWQAAAAAAWALIAVQLPGDAGALVYLWSGIGSLLLTASGVREASPRRITLGLAGFGLTVVVFYFGSVMDKLGRATALLVGGLLFLGVGLGFERARRHLMRETLEK